MGQVYGTSSSSPSTRRPRQLLPPHRPCQLAGISHLTGPGEIPSLLGYFLVQTWTAARARFGIVSKPFTKQENTVIQTCVVACYGFTFSVAFGSYMLAMDRKPCDLSGADYSGNRVVDVKNPSLSSMVSFIFVVTAAQIPRAPCVDAIWSNWVPEFIHEKIILLLWAQQIMSVYFLDGIFFPYLESCREVPQLRSQGRIYHITVNLRTAHKV